MNSCEEFLPSPPNLAPCDHEECGTLKCTRRQAAKDAGVWAGGSDRRLPIGRRAARRIRRFARRLLKVDDVMLSSPGSSPFVYVVAQNLRHTTDDVGAWQSESGERRDWYYYSRRVLCSGRSEEELKESVRLYHGASQQDGLEFLMNSAGFSEKLKKETRDYLDQYGNKFGSYKEGPEGTFWRTPDTA